MKSLLNKTTRLHSCDLMPEISVADSIVLSAAMASMTPWKELGMTASVLNSYLLKEDPSLIRLSVRVSDSLAGVIMLRIPWLRGPYLELLCVLPEYQRLGIGRTVVIHLINVASERFSNFWVCASEFNIPALKFYESLGFKRKCVINDLVAEGRSEVLLQRRLSN